MKNLLMIALLTTLSSSLALAGAKIDPALIGFAHGEGPRATTVIGILDTTKLQENESDRPEKYDTRAVLKFLRDRANQAWQGVESQLQQNGDLSHSIKLIRVQWINSSFVAVVTPTGLKALAEATGIKKIYSNRKVVFEKPYHEGSFTEDAPTPGKAPYDYDETNLTKLIAEAPQLTGKGVVIGSVDTGVDGSHPALAGKIPVFYDATLKKVSEPKDYDSHGTHTAGTMVGGDRQSLLIGMAPDAKLVAAGPLENYDLMLKSMEFLLDPDGNSNVAHIPRAINNSWHCGGAPDIELFYRAIAAWEAAGILPVFSAGNSGPNPSTITPCHEHPSVIAIGATGKDGKITNFSSRGPGKYKGQDVQKPDITAPGEKIYSTLPNGKFGEYSGTSMAAPHVTGATALLYQIEPKLTPAQVRGILVKTAMPIETSGSKGTAGDWNPVYGFGKLDIYAAAKAALSLHKERMGVEAGPLDLLANLFKTPGSIDVLSLLTSSEKLEDSELEMPAVYEGAESSWSSL